MGFLFGFKPKKPDSMSVHSPNKVAAASTSQFLHQSLKDAESGKSNSTEGVCQVTVSAELKKPTFRKVGCAQQTDVDLTALQQLISVISLQLEQDEKFGIVVENYVRTEHIIQQLLKEKRQLETFRNIILGAEPANLASVLTKLEAKISFLQDTLPRPAFSR